MAAYSVIIPVYNEEDILQEKLRQLMGFLDANAPDYEIIVCSNGSTDRTDEIGRSLNGGKIRFVSISERGVGRAFKRMVEEAGTEKLVSIDVDLTSDLRFIPQCVKLLDEASIVIGSKNMGSQERKWYRLLISGAFIGLVRLLLGLRYDDYSIGTKGWRRGDIIKYVAGIDGGSSYVIEIVYFVEQVDGKKVAVLPVHCNDTRGSKFNLVNEIFYRFRNLIRLWRKVKF